MEKRRTIRVGIFDQIVSGGGVYKFTLRLVEGLSNISDGKWHYHLMWPLFDSGNEFLHEVELPNVTFERIRVSYKSGIYNLVAPFFFRGGKAASDLDQLSRKITRLINVGQLSELRSYRGEGLDWLNSKSDSFDMFYCPYTYLTFPKNRDWQPRKPLVVTVHDLAHEHTDAWGVMTQDVREEVRKWLHAASHVIFSSKYVKNESIRIYGLNEENASSIYLAPLEVRGGVGAGTKEHRFGKGYIFTMGWFAKHKRVETIIEGFAICKKKYGLNVPLVIAGPYTNRLSLRNDLGLEKGRDIFLLGYVKDEEIPSLYSSAGVVVTASVSEAGFNAMIYDAMNFKVPVICSAIPQFMERLGNKNEMALTFDPYDPESLALALKAHFKDVVAAVRRAERAKEYISQRDWHDVARDYMAVFEKVLKKN